MNLSAVNAIFVGYLVIHSDELKCVGSEKKTQFYPSPKQLERKIVKIDLMYNMNVS